MKDMYSRTEYITPQRAAALLSTSRGNRKIRQYNKVKLKNALLNGEFQLTHQGIAIDENGHLIDGHHRLEALVETGIGARLYVTYNAPRSAYIDTNSLRSFSDSLYMSGIIDANNIERDRLAMPLAALIIRMTKGREAEKQSTAMDRHRAYIEHKEAMETILRISNSKKGPRSRQILYAMLCAYEYGISEEVLKNWFSILATGDFYVDGDEKATKAGRSILLLKNYLDGQRTAHQTKVNDKDLDMIKRCMSSIRHYANQKPIEKLYGEQVYPFVTVEEAWVKEL